MEPCPFPKARILIVDDNEANVLLLSTLLKRSGYLHLFEMYQGEGVVGFCQQEQIDLILLDLMMPVVSGFDVLAELKATLGEWAPPVLVLTAIQDKDVCLEALKVGARDLLAKPFSLPEVRARVKNLLEIRMFEKQMVRQNRILELRVRERTQQLFDTRLEIIQRLGRAAEYRDNETGLHTTRMSRISRILGLAVGLSEDEAELLMQAAPMHDIGKIGIPDNILLKPAGFDTWEWEIMKTHTTIGGMILSGGSSDLLRQAETIALGHHEKWDGSGYPKSLKGEEIPLCCRLVALADVFDALTTARPYKAAWSIDEALAHFKAQRGRHFEPRLVDVFLENFQAILDVKNTFSESANREGETWKSNYLSG